MSQLISDLFNFNFQFSIFKFDIELSISHFVNFEGPESILNSGFGEGMDGHGWNCFLVRWKCCVDYSDRYFGEFPKHWDWAALVSLSQLAMGNDELQRQLLK